MAAPAQEGLVPLVSAMATDGATAELMVIVIALEVAGLPSTPTRFEVITQVTTWPVVSDVVVNVGELVPAFTPLTFHW